MPSTTPSPSSGGCRASSPASRGRSRTCRTWRSPAPPAARTCWPSRRTPSTSGAGSCGAVPSGGSPPPRSPRCRPSCRPSRPSTSATTASSTAAAPVADHQPIQGRVRRTCTDQIDPKEKRHACSCMQVCKEVSNGIYYSTREERDKMDGWMDGWILLCNSPGSHPSQLTSPTTAA